MATFTGGFSSNGSYRLRLEIWEDTGSINIAMNTSVVHYQLWVDKLVGSGYYSGSGSSGSSCDGGMSGASGLGGNWIPYNFSSYSSLMIAAGSKTVSHNPDGTGYISGKFSANDSTNFGSADAVYGLTLTTIPRASTTMFPSSDITVGTAATGTIDRASTLFTHELSYSIGSMTGQTAGLSAYTGVATSFTFTPPLSVLKQMVGEAAKALVLTTITKNGATVIGSKNTVLNALPPSNIPYAAPNPSATVIRCGPGGAVDPDGEYIKITPAFSVGSIYTSSEQNTLTYKIEAKTKAAGSYPATPLVNATVGSHGLSFTTPLVYGDYDPSTGGTQPFDENTTYDIRITITDALGSVVVNQLILYLTDAIVDFYRPTKGLSVGRKYDNSLGGSLQLVEEGYQRDGKLILDEENVSGIAGTYPLQPWRTKWLPLLVDLSKWTGRTPYAWGSPLDSRYPIWFTRSVTGIVTFTGLINPRTTITNGTILGVLPPGYRPSRTETYGIWETDTRQGVTIDTDGVITLNLSRSLSPATTYMSLNNVVFFSAEYDLSWTNCTMLNGWTADPTRPPQWAYDTDGMVWLRGRATKAGTFAVGNVCSGPPMPTVKVHVPAYIESGWGYLGIDIASNIRLDFAGGSGGLSLAGIHYDPPANDSLYQLVPGAVGSGPYGDVNYANSYSHYSSFITGFRQRPDGLVKMKGLMTGGSIGLPAFYLPHSMGGKHLRNTWMSVATSGIARIDVTGAGRDDGYAQAVYMAAGTSTWQSLDAILLQPGSTN